MSSVTTFFRHCPSCGRRFEIRLVDESPVSTERDMYPTTRTGLGSSTAYAPRMFGSHAGRFIPAMQTWDRHVVLEEKVETTVWRKGFQYSYKCKHCGHQWTEKRFNETQTSVERRHD